MSLQRASKTQAKKMIQFHIHVLLYFIDLAPTSRCQGLPKAAWDKPDTAMVLE